MGVLSRRKGRRFEQVVASAFRQIFGESVKRGWQSRLGSDAPDVENVPGWWVEAKHCARVNIQKAYAQARMASVKSGDGLRPLVVAKDNGTAALAVLSFDDFLWLIERTRGLERDLGLANRDVEDLADPSHADGA